MTPKLLHFTCLVVIASFGITVTGESLNVVPEDTVTEDSVTPMNGSDAELASKIFLGEFSTEKIKKAYYSAEVSVSRDQAKIYCENNEMQLVSIDSDAEFDYLGSSLPRHRYWTSGKSTKGYKWEDGTPVSRPVYVFNRISCVVLFWAINKRANLYGDPCDGSLASGYRPLCQATSTK